MAVLLLQAEGSIAGESSPITRSEQVVVAVFFLPKSDADSALVSVVGDQLARQSAALPGARLIIGTALGDVLGRSPNEAIEECGSALPCIAALGRKAGAEKVVIVRLGPAGAESKVAFLLVKTDTAEIEKKAASQIASAEQAPAIINEQFAKLLPDTVKVASDAAGSRSVPSPPKPVPAIVAYQEDEVDELYRNAADLSQKLVNTIDTLKKARESLRAITARDSAAVQKTQELVDTVEGALNTIAETSDAARRLVSTAEPLTRNAPTKYVGPQASLLQEKQRRLADATQILREVLVRSADIRSAAVKLAECATSILLGNKCEPAAIVNPAFHFEPALRSAADAGHSPGREKATDAPVEPSPAPRTASAVTPCPDSEEIADTFGDALGEECLRVIAAYELRTDLSTRNQVCDSSPLRGYEDFPFPWPSAGDEKERACLRRRSGFLKQFEQGVQNLPNNCDREAFRARFKNRINAAFEAQCAKTLTSFMQFFAAYHSKDTARGATWGSSAREAIEAIPGAVPTKDGNLLAKSEMGGYQANIQYRFKSDRLVYVDVSLAAKPPKEDPSYLNVSSLLRRQYGKPLLDNGADNARRDKILQHLGLGSVVPRNGEFLVGIWQPNAETYIVLVEGDDVRVVYASLALAPWANAVDEIRRARDF